MHNFYVFRAEFRDPFNTLTADGIVTNPIDIVHSCVGKIRAGEIYSPVYKSGEIYSHYIQTEMRTFHPALHNFEGIFFRLGGSVFNKVDSYNGMGSGSVVLFIENLDVDVTKFKKKFVFRDAKGRKIL